MVSEVGVAFGPPGSLLFIDILFTLDRQKQTHSSDEARATWRPRGRGEDRFLFGGVQAEMS